MEIIMKKILFTFFLFGALIATCTANETTSQTTAQNLTPFSYRNVARMVSPSVVSVRIKQNITSGLTGALNRKRPTLIVPFGMSDELRQQLEQMLDEQYQHLAPGEARGKQYVGTASGVIIRNDGFIVTSYHVIASAQNFAIEVTLSDGTAINEVEVYGYDELTDLAVLKIKTDKELKAATWGDSDSLEPGDIVVAIGNPLDFTNSISEGIVSAKHRVIKKAPIEDLIQTTAMINPGNSGGALCNLDGQLVGINMAIATDTGLWSGLGFAIPSKIAQNITDQIISNRHVSRGFLGIEMSPLSPQLATQLNYKGQQGIVVRNVTPNSSAEKAGLKRYDIISKVDSQDISEPSEMLTLIGRKNKGDNVLLEIWRDMSQQGMAPFTTTVTLGERPNDRRNYPVLPGDNASGPTKQDSPDNLGFELKQNSSGKGLVVVSVNPNGQAAMIGIQSGDIIYEINKQPTNSIEDFNNALQKPLMKGTHLIYLERNGSSIFAQIESK